MKSGFYVLKTSLKFAVYTQEWLLIKSGLWWYAYGNSKKNRGYFLKFCGLVTISEIMTTSEALFWKIMETGEPNSTQPSW